MDHSYSVCPICGESFHPLAASKDNKERAICLNCLLKEVEKVSETAFKSLDFKIKKYY